MSKDEPIKLTLRLSVETNERAIAISEAYGQSLSSLNYFSKKAVDAEPAPAKLTKKSC